MQWPPEMPTVPDDLARFHEALVERIDSTTPQDGTGTRTADAAGGAMGGKGGKSVNQFGSGGKETVVINKNGTMRFFAISATELGPVNE